MSVKLIAAVGRNMELGADNALLWNLPEDMKYFRDKTRGSTVIMGRKTFESIGRPLPKRRNIVISRNRDFHPEGAEVFATLQEALCAANSDAFVIGGAQIYSLALEYADEIYLTEIDMDYPAADVFCPGFEKEKYERSYLGGGCDGGVSYTFVLYRKKA